MPSGTSFFNPTLFRKNLTRFWPIWSIFFALWFFRLPVTLWLNFRPFEKSYATPSIYDTLRSAGVPLAFLFGIVAAIAVFSYLYNARSVHLFHSLPVKRESLFLTNYLSGLSFLVVPLWINGVLSLAIQAGVGLDAANAVLVWTALSTLQVFFFYSFAVFCAMFTGHALALPAFYVILNFLAMGLFSVLNSMLSQFIYGFSRSDWLDTLAEWLTPAIHMLNCIRYGNYGNDDIPIYSGIPPLLLYTLVGIIFTVLALVVYRKRSLESAGDVVSVSWVRPIFKYGVAFCSAVILGAGLHDILNSVLPSGFWFLLPCLLLTGLVGYFAAEMLLKKSFKVFRKAWKGAVCFCLALTLLGCGLEYDVLRFNRVPNADAVVSVRLSGVYTMPSDSGGRNYEFTSPEDIATVLRLHQKLTAAKNLSSNTSDRVEEATVEGGYTISVDVVRTLYISLDYELRDGSYLHREYSVSAAASDLGTEGSIPWLLNELVNDPDMTAVRYFDRRADGKLIEAGIDLFNVYTGEYDTLYVKDEEDRLRLLDAIRQDMADGNLGRRYLFDSMDRYENCSVGDMYLTFYAPNESSAGDIAAAPVGTAPYAKAEQTWNISVTPQFTAANTIKVLTDLGLIDEEHILVSHAGEPAAKAAAAANAQEPSTTLITIK